MFGFGLLASTFRISNPHTFSHTLVIVCFHMGTGRLFHRLPRYGIRAAIDSALAESSGVGQSVS